MTVTRHTLLILVAVVLFAVDFVLVLSDSTNAKLITEFLYAGLAFFAAAFLP